MSNASDTDHILSDNEPTEASVTIPGVQSEVNVVEQGDFPGAPNETRAIIESQTDSNLSDTQREPSGAAENLGETPMKKMKLSSEDAEGSHEECVYDKFTQFAHLEMDVPFNVGTFGVFSAKHVPYGEDAQQDKPYTDFILIDGEQNTAWFRIYGNKASEYKDIKPQQVIHIEGFMWRTAYETAIRAHGVSSKCFGTMTDDSILVINEELSHLYADKIKEEKPHVFSLSELEKQFGLRVVLTLNHKNMTTTGNKQGEKINVRSVVFLTAENIPVELTAFQEQINKLDALVDGQTYMITNLKVARFYKYAKITHRYTITEQTTFTLSKVEKVEIVSVKADLKDLMDKGEDVNTIYESELFVRMKSAEVKNKGYFQTTGFEFNENTDSHLAAIIHFQDCIELRRGQKIRFKYHVRQSMYNKKELNVVPGSMEILADDLSFPLDMIDTLICKLI